MPRRNVDVKKQIFTVLQKHKKVTWSQLLRETKTSKGAVSKYLNELLKIGIVQTTIDTTKRPPRTLYSLSLGKAEVAMRFLLEGPIAKQIGKFKSDLSKVESKEKKRSLFNKFFGYSLLAMLAENIGSLYTSLKIAYSTNDSKEAEDFYSYFQKTANAGRELLTFFLASPEYMEYALDSLNEVVWVAQLLEEEPGEFDHALTMLLENISKLQETKRNAATLQ